MRSWRASLASPSAPPTRGPRNNCREPQLQHTSTLASATVRTFPYLLLPHVWSSRNRARRRQRGDLMRGLVFGGVGVAVCVLLFLGSSWVTGQLADYAELGDYLLRLGLSWLFLTFLSFLAF